MKIRKLRVLNYKGFRDSGDLTFGDGFNVIVGVNNSGKTALLEAFALRQCPSKPHRSLAVEPGMEDPYSWFNTTIEVSGSELRTAIFLIGGTVWCPVPSQLDDKDGYVNTMFVKDRISFQIQESQNQAIKSAVYPSHQLFPDEPSKFALQINPKPDRTGFTFSHGSTSADEVPNVVDFIATRQIYVFKAERMYLGASGVAETDVLHTNGSNLASVLFKLSGNTARFGRFNQHVREIFPHIFGVVAAPSGVNASVRVWMVDPASERIDLSIPLEECGTGVGQVLAILYVAITRQSNVLVIDEPNSFLHPGAAKKLIEILKQYDDNQYIISTHSPELIAIAEPDTIHSVKWNGSESVVEEYRRSSILDMQRILSDLGASLSDVFSADKIVWVEGPTEAACFPKLAQLIEPRPVGVAFVPLRSTADLDVRTDAKALLDIYRNLSAGVGLIPPTIAFNLDIEGRNPAEIAEITKESGGQVKFLPRAMYENYLLDVDAIAAVLTSELAHYGASTEVVAADVQVWMDANAKLYAKETVWNGDLANAEWLAQSNGAKLLHDLFLGLSGATMEFRKTRHSVMLTEWMIDNKSDAITELIDYVKSLVG